MEDADIEMVRHQVAKKRGVFAPKQLNFDDVIQLSSDSDSEHGSYASSTSSKTRNGDVACTSFTGARGKRNVSSLAFSNPGRLNADVGILDRGRRRDASNNFKSTIVYDKNGQLVNNIMGVPHRICDCLQMDCPGCFHPCNKCDSMKCGPICQVNRKFIPVKLTDQGHPSRESRNPLLSEEMLRDLERQGSRSSVSDLDDEYGDF